MNAPEMSPNALGWPCTLLQERFGHPFVLRQSEQALWLELPGSEGAIGFAGGDPNLRGVVEYPAWGRSGLIFD